MVDRESDPPGNVGRVRTAWERLRLLFSVLAIIRFSILVPAALIVTLIASDQMSDALIGAADNGIAAGGTTALLLTTIFAALVVWYTARTMLRFRFDGNPASNPAVHPSLKRHLPRLLAVCVPVALLVRVLLLHSAVAALTVPKVWKLSASFAIAALLVSLYVYQRRRIARIRGLRILGTPEAQEARNLTRFAQLPTTTWLLLLALLVMNAAALALAIADVLGAIGAPALLLLALGLMAVTGSVLVYMANHYRVPILTILVLWAAFWSFFNDNHAVRQTLDSRSHGFLHRATPIPVQTLQASPLATDTLSGYFDEWWTALAQAHSGPDPVPVVVVAADGGGIRAAYWTGLVLAALQDQSQHDPIPFSRYVFAISSVSGGSLGAAAFDAAVARRAEAGTHSDSRSYEEEMTDFLGRDFLSPTLANALFPDLLQRFLPLPIFDDRAIALERSWERGWSATHPGGKRRFADPFHDLWKTRSDFVPLLFLNGTVVETGQRSIMSPLATAPSIRDPTFSNVLPLGPVLGTELPLSTAVLLSARFTYVSPAGLIGLPDRHTMDRRRIVDGGYFDNSGGVTAEEIVRAILKAHADLRGPTPTKPMRLIVLHIPNDPPNPRRPIVDWCRISGGRVWLGELLSPVRALLNTRPARATQAVEYLRGWADPSTDSDLLFYDVVLYREGTDLPLGWALSMSVQTEMSRQIDVCPKGAASNCAARAIPLILDALHGQPRPAEREPPEFARGCPES